LEGFGSHSCDLNCVGGQLPTISKIYPLTSGVVGHSPMGETRTTTEEFFPRLFHFLSASETSAKITIKSLRLLEVELQFTLKGYVKLYEHLYEKEFWKTQHLQDLLKEIGQKVDYPFAPILSVSLDEGLRVIKESVRTLIDGTNVLTVANDTCELVGLPDCEPPLTDEGKLRHSGYSYFGGKFTVLSSQLSLGSTYKIVFSLEAINFFYEVGLLLPFRFVEWKTTKIASESPDVIIAKRGYRIVSSVRGNAFPPRQEYEWGTRGDVSGRYPPKMVIADPFRKQPLLGKTEKAYEINEEQTINTLNDNYELLEFKIYFGTPKDKAILTDVQITESPLPVRIYDQLQKLPRYRDFLISYDIINFSDDTVDLEIKSEIVGITDPAINNIKIPGKKDVGKKRVVLAQCPILKFNILEKISRETQATLQYKITQKGTTDKILEENTKIVKLLPQDTIIWSMADQRTNTVYDLSPLIGAWVSPTDSKGLLDGVRGGAAKYHPAGALVGNQSSITLSEITSQVKAMYEYLNNEVGIRYVNQAFTHGFNSGGQRVVLPERVIEAKCGNCIDLVVLFASLMEGLGLDPLFLLTQNHAFLGWGNKYKTSEMGFLECTLLGSISPDTGVKYTFEETSAAAEKYYKENFLLIGSDDYLPIHSVILGDKNNQIIDLKETRKEGIYRN